MLLMLLYGRRGGLVRQVNVSAWRIQLALLAVRSARRLPRYMYPGTYNELHVHVLSPSSSSSSSSYASFPPSSAT